MRHQIQLLFLLVFIIFPSLLTAHPGHVEPDGFFAAFMHVLTGIDHIVAMLAVGAWSIGQSGKMVWAGPASFAGAALVGMLVATGGYHLAGVEHGVAASLLVFGLVLAALTDVPRLVVLGIFAVFGIFHGQAHAAEMATSGLAIAGFVTASIFFHVLGMVGASLSIQERREGVLRATGFATAGAGLVMFAIVIV